MNNKKIVGIYSIIWALCLGLFNVVTFVVPAFYESGKSMVSFWFGYGLITLCFVGQLICGIVALGVKNAASTFYNLSLVRTSYIGVIVSLIVGGLCMKIAPATHWIGVVVCVAVLVFNIIAVLKASVAVDAVTAIDRKIKVQTYFIKSLTVDAEALMNRAATEDMKAECRKVYEAVRYSDPMSDPALAADEGQITAAFAVLTDAVASEDADRVKRTADELVLLIKTRNGKCKLLK